MSNSTEKPNFQFQLIVRQNCGTICFQDFQLAERLERNELISIQATRVP